MHTNSRRLTRKRTGLVPALIATLLLPSLYVTPAVAAGLSPGVITCRAAIGKASTRLSKTLVKAVTGCNKARGRDASLSTTNCDSIDTADLKGAVAGAETKFTSAVTGNKCSGVAPADALYTECPSPCSSTSISTLADVAT